VKRFRRLGLVAVVVAAMSVLLAGCGMRLTHYAGYRGSGTFTAQTAPAWICQDGYTVDLGSVDLGATGESNYELAGLPPIESTIGLAVARNAPDGEDGEVIAAHRPQAFVELTLRDANGHIVLSRRERLTQWIASRRIDDPDHAYLFQRGTEAEIAVAPGVVRVERFPIGPDDSWGTYFTPRRDARYALHFAVEEPDDGVRDLDVRLQVRAVVGCP